MISEMFGEPISVYSRDDALRDGVLIAADPETCREAGILWPVAMTDHLWSYIDPGNLEEMPDQSVSGRLWDLLWMFATSAKMSRGESRIKFRVSFQMKTGRTRPRVETIMIIGVCGPGDEGEPVITLMLPEDD